MTPRQPALNAFRGDQVPIPASMISGKNEKSANVFTSSHFVREVFCFGIVMEKNENFMRALKCRECGREYPLAATHVCEFDFGPLEVVYDYDRIKRSLTREAIQSRPKSMWRYRE